MHTRSSGRRAHARTCPDVQDGLRGRSPGRPTSSRRRRDGRGSGGSSRPGMRGEDAPSARAPAATHAAAAATPSAPRPCSSCGPTRARDRGAVRATADALLPAPLRGRSPRHLRRRWGQHLVSEESRRRHAERISLGLSRTEEGYAQSSSDVAGGALVAAQRQLDGARVGRDGGGDGEALSRGTCARKKARVASEQSHQPLGVLRSQRVSKARAARERVIRGAHRGSGTTNWTPNVQVHDHRQQVGAATIKTCQGAA